MVLSVSTASLLGQTNDGLPPVTTVPEAWIQKINWRSIGPANMGGRITAIAVYEKDPNIWWAATASGGLLKTVNNGTTFEHQFDRQATVSIGDVQVHPCDPNIVWVGTGEANPRNSVSWGDGVYKSVDGGKTWVNKGLKGSFQIGRIALHPTDPKIVFVAALGRLWGKNEERGLYKSIDGGETWNRVVYIDDQTGVVDVQIDPANPANILAATYERLRDGFDGNDPLKKYGAGAGIYRSVDGGETFSRVTQGLPAGKLGRIGLSYYAADPSFVYAIVESEKIASIPDDSPTIALRTVDAEVGAKVDQITKDSFAEKAGLKVGDIVVEVGEVVVLNSEQFWRQVRVNKAGDKVRLELSRDKKSVVLEIELEKAAVEDGPSAGRNPFTGVLGGQAANLQDQQGAAGADFGGVYQSSDGGQSWQRINSLNPRPMYYSQIRVDPKDNQNVYVLGTAMHRSKDGGKEFGDTGDRGVHPDHHALWIDPRDPRHMILGNDGGIYVTYDQMENWDHLNHVAIGQFYHVAVDPRRDYRAYGGLQDNGSWGGPTRVAHGPGPANSDWINVGGGDGFVCLVDPEDPDIVYSESQNGGMVRLNVATGQQSGISPRPQKDVKYRFNWKSPMALAPQNSRILYTAGNFVFRSVAAGDALIAISPEITNTEQGSGSAISVSPLEYGVVYVGTTDGAIWMTRDDGKNWSPIFSRPQPKTADAPQTPASPRLVEDQALAGHWELTLGSDQKPDQKRSAVLDLEIQPDETIRGSAQVDSRTIPIAEAKFDAAKKELRLYFGDRDRDYELIATISGRRLKGEFDIDFGLDHFPVTGWRLPAEAVGKPVDPTSLVGTWQGALNADAIPAAMNRVELTLESDPQTGFKGNMAAANQRARVTQGQLDPATGSFMMTIRNEDMSLDVSTRVVGDVMVGEIVGGGGALRFDFFVEKKPEAIKDPNPPPTPDNNPPPPIESPSPPKPPVRQESPQEPGDPVAGAWTGSFVGNRFRGDQGRFEMTLVRANEKITGSLMTNRGETKISGGSFDPATGKLVLAGANENSTVEISATLSDARLRGTAKMGRGRFTVDFEASRSDQIKSGPAGEPLEKLVPAPRWISSLAASAHEAARVYLAMDGHRSDDDSPYVFASEDYGQSWRSLRGNLPSEAGPPHVIKEDPDNPDLLYLGCEFSAWVSIDRGQSWTKFVGLPTVAVHELALHAMRHEIVAATHGRSLWVADIDVLKQLRPAALQAPSYLFQPNTAILWRRTASRGSSGTRRFLGENPPSGANIFYTINSDCSQVEIVMRDAVGTRLKTLPGTIERGLQRVTWDYSTDAARATGRRGRRSVGPGDYVVELQVDGAVAQRSVLKVLADPNFESSASEVAEEREKRDDSADY
jgi:photosystem II stability/assembly factor-like uncharacterized protein